MMAVSKGSLQWLVGEYGGQLAALEVEAAVCAPTRDEGWKEVKSGDLFNDGDKCGRGRDEEKEVRLGQHSYRAVLGEAKEFAKHQWAEGCRRGLERARQVVVIADGAPWIVMGQ